MAARPGCLFFM